MNIENNLLENVNYYVLMNIELDNMKSLYLNLLNDGSITKETFDIMMKKIDDERNFLNGKNSKVKKLLTEKMNECSNKMDFEHTCSNSKCSIGA